MDLLLLLLNVSALGIGYALYKRQKPSPAPTPSKSTLPVQLAPVDPSEHRLNIAGTELVPVSQRGFVRGFGLRPERLIELRSYAGAGDISSFPEHVSGCLRLQYREGLAYGVETMQLVCQGGELMEGQALYFALVSTGPVEYPPIIVFVDKERPVAQPVQALG
jgi:hypothetical protein